jgi:hypothetical protein
MHCYLYVRCKTPNCPAKLHLYHSELPLEAGKFTYVDLPDEWFPAKIECGSCGQTHSYVVKDVQSESSLEPHHSPEWKPFFRDPPPKPGDIN